jgi:hypothetical protein
MSTQLQIRGGAVSGLPTLAARELGTTTDQKRLYVGDGSANHVLGLKHNIAATVAPGVNDDAGAGYSVGSEWVDTTHAKTYICVDSTVGAAAWQQMSPSTITGAALTKTDDANITLALGGRRARLWSTRRVSPSAGRVTCRWRGAAPGPGRRPGRWPISRARLARTSP